MAWMCFVAQTMISEVGLDMSRWKIEAHLAPWLGLCPDNRITLLKKPDLPRCAVPTPTQQARCPESRHCDGSSPGPTGLSNAQVWAAVRRQRRRILRAKKPPTTNRVPQKESSPTRPAGHSRPSLNYQQRSFWRVVPAQTVDATQSSQLIRHYFRWKADLLGGTRSKPSQGSVPVIQSSERF